MNNVPQDDKIVDLDAYREHDGWRDLEAPIDVRQHSMSAPAQMTDAAYEQIEADSRALVVALREVMDSDDARIEGDRWGGRASAPPPSSLYLAIFAAGMAFAIIIGYFVYLVTK